MLQVRVEEVEEVEVEDGWSRWMQRLDLDRVLLS